MNHVIVATMDNNVLALICIVCIVIIVAALW